MIIIFLKKEGEEYESEKTCNIAYYFYDFSFVQIPESAQAETQQGELTAQSQYSASNITKPLNIKYKDRQGVLYTLNNQDLTAKVAS